MGLDKVAIRQVITIAKNSSRMKGAITAMENEVINLGLGLIEKAGIDPNTLPIDIRSVLRGEAPSFDPTKLLTPEIICAQPQMTIQQKEETTRLITSAENKVTAIYAATNKIKATILELKTPINGLQEKTQPVVESINALSDIVQIIKLLALPTSAPPGVGVPLSVPNTFASTLITLGEFLEKAQANVNLIPAATSTLIGLLSSVTIPLNRISTVTDPFVNILGMVKAVVDLQDVCPLLTQADIDANKALLLGNIIGQLGTLDPFTTELGNVLEERLTPNAVDPFYYKNFRFILEYDPNNTFTFPSRRIRMVRENSVGVNDGLSGYGSKVIIYNINKTTNPDLVPESFSYASDINVLVLEGKYAVDVYTGDITIWEAPAFRNNIVLEGEVFDLTALSEEELIQFGEQNGFFGDYNQILEALSSQNYQYLPTFLVYGGTSVNLNNSPTDIEYGANALVDSSSFSGVQSLDITSYIQTGTIQVNKPVQIEMTTYGGSGSPGTTEGFTEALLTIKRSFAIQDNINPFTGRIGEFFSDSTSLTQSAIDDWVGIYGTKNLETLKTLNELFTGPSLFNIQDLPNSGLREDLSSDKVSGLSYLDTLKFLYEAYYVENPTEPKLINTRNPQTLELVDLLYSRTKPILYNEDALLLSKKLLQGLGGLPNELTGNASVDAANLIQFVSTNSYPAGDRFIISVGYGGTDQTYAFWYKVVYQNNRDNNLSNMNWYYAARKNAYGEARFGNTKYDNKAATLGMMKIFGEQITGLYNSLFNLSNSPDYNGGAWVGGPSTIPIIPSSVSIDNEDIVIALEATQTASREETLKSIVGSLELLGTYTYSLEIINSIPLSGGAEENYPTNFTKFTVKII